MLCDETVAVEAQLPQDVVVEIPFEMIYDEDLVTGFCRRYGIEVFVETCYCYILERQSDPGGLKGFSDELRAKVTTAYNVLRGMYFSEERRSKGPFLGPTTSDYDYPFRV